MSNHPNASSPRRARGPLFLLVMALVAIVGLAPAATAQVTTGNITGRVLANDGSALPGVTVEAVHVPTGTRYQTVTGGDGFYTFPNVRVGGPYAVTATLEGFQTAQTTNVMVNLGQTATASMELALSSVSETIEVTAQTDDIINPNRTGSASSVSEEALQSLPTVNRSLQDFARTNPYFSVDAQDFSSTRMYVAGRNNRYNQIQIDGAVNNDLFGLSDTGTPGGQTDTQPVSIDAVEQLQLVVSPYDVRQGGFTGGGVNAVTRSGSNEFNGSLFYAPRTEAMVGDGPFDSPVANFEQTQYVARIGGPIIRDKMFFFLNADVSRRDQPTDVSADGSTGTAFNNPTEAARIADYARTRYGFDVGGLGDFPQTTDSDLGFVRFDFNLGTNHNLLLRHNYVDAVRDVVADRSTTRFRYPNSIYTIADETNSTVAQLNSVFTATAFNELRLGYQTIRDQRALPVTFPSVEIGGTGPRNGTYILGSERFSTANSLDQDIIEITNDMTLLRGNHQITIGTHNELFEFKNLFINESVYGYYYFPTVADWEAGNASFYGIGFANGTGGALRPTQFEAHQYGVYVNDQYRLSDEVTITMGLRADMPQFLDTPTYNPVIEQSIGIRNDTTPSEQVVISPRLGFNYNPGGRGNQQFRGGLGVFAGRTPYVWISNGYGGTGVETTVLSCQNTCVRPVFNADPLNQPRSFPAGGGAFEVALTDPDFQFPRVFRATLGYDRDLFWGIRSTVEAVYSQTQQDIFYYNMNKRPTGQTSFDGRPRYTSVSTRISDALMLSNTSKGHETTATVQLSRPFRNGLIISGNYAWQDANSAHDGTSSTAGSNWRFRHTKGDIFEQDLSRSAFEVEHRINAAISYNFNTGPVGHTFGLYWNAQSGRPYSIMESGDPNGDGATTNDILYVPHNDTEIILQDASGAVIPYERLAAFLRRAGIDPYAGRILDRYETREPWSRQLDFHYGFDVPIGGFRPEITIDLVNLVNMFDEDAHVTEYVANQNYTVVQYRGIDTATGKAIYREAQARALEPGRQFVTAEFRARWQAKVGLRLNF